MQTNKPMCIGLSLAPTWLSGHAWRQQNSGVESYYDPTYYAQIAQRAEQAVIDFVFRPDSLFVDHLGLAQAPGFSGLDPNLLLTYVAANTKHINMITTASTTFNAPFHVARQLQSLNWISQGRIGWNIVTALDGNQNFGVETMPSPEARYQQASEFTQVVKSLWRSFPHTALKFDKRSGEFADTSQVQPIAHHGEQFQVAGPLSTPSYQDIEIPLFQAGASDTGKCFAAATANAVFAATPNQQEAKVLRDELRSRACEAGRQADDIKVLPGVSLYLAETQEAANQAFAYNVSRKSLAKRQAFVLEATGIDVSTLAMDTQVTATMMQPMQAAPRSRTHSELVRKYVASHSPTVEALLTCPEVAGSAHWLIVGTVDDAVAQLQQWYLEGAIDGAILLPGSVTTLNLIFSTLMPKLQSLGLSIASYQSRSFIDRLNA